MSSLRIVPRYYTQIISRYGFIVYWGKRYMGGTKLLAAPTAQRQSLLPLSQSVIQPTLFWPFGRYPSFVHTNNICWWKFVFKNQLFYISVKPSHFFTETEYSIDTSDFCFSYASLLLAFIFQKYRRRKVDTVHKFDVNLVSWRMYTFRRKEELCTSALPICINVMRVVI